MKLSNQRTSLRALRTFCIAARLMSFKLAAEELFVTGSAVSHQVKNLEDELGIALFERKTRSLELTDAGKALFDEVDPLIRRIDEVTARFRTTHRRETLRISVQPFFASELFVPRLSEFTDAHPEIDMQIDTADERWELHPASADVSIRLFRSSPKDLVADAFYPLRLMPACTPALLEKIISAGGPATAAFPQIVHARRRGQWRRWAESAGLPVPEASSTIELNSTVAVMRAAEQGVGVAIIPMPLSQGILDSGRLVPLHRHEAATPDRFYFVCAPDQVEQPGIRALRRWVLDVFTDHG